MRTQIAKYDPDLIIDLIRGINEISGSLRTNAFDATPAPERAHYRRKIVLLSTIEEILDECCINIKSRGYTFISDAVCIILDMHTLDVCLNTDVYPYIADKYRIRKIDIIEHSIRNSISAGYERYITEKIQKDTIKIYGSKPTNKKFLLYIAQEVSKRYEGYA